MYHQTELLTLSSYRHVHSSVQTSHTSHNVDGKSYIPGLQFNELSIRSFFCTRNVTYSYHEI